MADIRFFQLVPPGTQFNFIGKFKYFITFSILSGILVVGLIFWHGFHYGIDFTGGTVLQVQFDRAMPPDKVRAILSGAGAADAVVVGLGSTGREYIITVRTVAQKGELALKERLRQLSGTNPFQILKEDVVGPKVGAELKMASLRALFYSIIIITIYIWYRFDFKFAPGATLAMVHDLLLSCGFYLLTGREFTITAVAALLTIAGYSVNDTIVVYDRVREILKRTGDAVPLPKVINEAINLTLSRTLLSSGVTLLSILPIIFFTTGEIQSFAMAMCFGIFVGTYSTVYIASPFTVTVQMYLDRRNGRAG